MQKIIPSETFFKIALESLQVSLNEVIVVGDDITSDIVGAERMEMRSVLVKTGKFKPTQLLNGSGDTKEILPCIKQRS